MYDILQLAILKNSTPRSIKLSLKNVEMDLLSEGNIRLPASITLTFTFKSVSKEANSRPITPPPTIAILSEVYQFVIYHRSIKYSDD